MAVEAAARLIATGEPVHFTLPNIAEFWNGVTWERLDIARPWPAVAAFSLFPAAVGPR